MAFDGFLKIPNIAGESRDEKHKEWIEILQFNWGIHQPKDLIRTGAGNAASPDARRADVDKFVIEKSVDKATPILMMNLALNNVLKEAHIELCRATKDKQKYMEYVLHNVLIKSVTPSGDPKGDDALPREQVVFGFDKVDVIYTETDQLTGHPKGDVKFTYDVARNKVS